MANSNELVELGKQIADLAFIGAHNERSHPRASKIAADICNAVQNEIEEIKDDLEERSERLKAYLTKLVNTSKDKSYTGVKELMKKAYYDKNYGEDLDSDVLERITELLYNYKVKWKLSPEMEKAEPVPQYRPDEFDDDGLHSPHWIPVSSEEIKGCLYEMYHKVGQEWASEVLGLSDSDWESD